MLFLKSLINQAVRCIPANNTHLYYLCRHYVDRYNSENNHNISTNGELRFMRQILNNCRAVFDVGANTGEWATLALSINPNLSLHCFEPSYVTYQQLLARAFPPHIVCNNFGLGSVREQRTLYVFEDGAGINSLYMRNGLEDGWGLTPQQRIEVVQLNTIDNYCQEHGIASIDFLKIDVEGHELEVLRGASEMLAKDRIKTIQFEYGGCNIDSRVLLKDFFEFFRHLPYALYKMYPKELRRVEHYDQRLENFQYQNWVVLRTE